MLIQFYFQNFESFREEATLDLSAAKMTEFSDRVVSIGSEKILPVAAIYGAISALKSIDIFKGAQCPVDIGLAPIGVERRD